MFDEGKAAATQRIYVTRLQQPIDIQVRALTLSNVLSVSVQKKPLTGSFSRKPLQLESKYQLCNIMVRVVACAHSYTCSTLVGTAQ